MTPDDVYALAKSGIFTLLWISAPVMIVALGVGLLIALFQALTSIQEVTLTFVPKILLVFLTLLLFLPMMSSTLLGYTEMLMDMVRVSGQG